MLRKFAAALQRNNKGLERREPALGQSGTFRSAIAMSALPPKADMCVATRDVRFGTTSYRRARACSGVRFGSALQNVMSALHLIATAKAKFRNSHVRFTPESDIKCGIVECRLRANSGHGDPSRSFN